MATVYKRGDCFYINWRENGKQWRRSLGKIDAGAAEKEKRELEARLTLGLDPTPHSPTLAEWIDDYCDALEAEGKGKKRRSELRHAKQRLGHLHIASLPARLVEDYRVARLREAKPETVGKEIRLLKAALNRAVALEVIERNTIAKIKSPRGVTSKAVPYFTKAQLAAIYKADAELAPLWRFMVNTGLRRSEFAKARRSDVRGSVLYVESTEDGRTKSARWREVRYIGKKSAHGHGKVLRVDVDPIDQDCSLIMDGRAMRWLPDPAGTRLVRPRPPYWHQHGRVACAEIGEPAAQRPKSAARVGGASR